MLRTWNKMSKLMKAAASPPRLAQAYAAISLEKVRYSDTDRQGHVNNVMFSAFLEAGRVEVLHCSGLKLNPRGTEFVLAQSNISLLGQLYWPGEVTVGTGIAHLGHSSFTFHQALFQRGVCAAVSVAVLVLMRVSTGKSTPLGARTRAFFESQRLKR
jgi:acyl-CoA thioester hydrolase